MTAGAVTGLVVDVGHLETTVLPVRSRLIPLLPPHHGADPPLRVGVSRQTTLLLPDFDTPRRLSPQFSTSISSSLPCFLCSAPVFAQLDDDTSSDPSTAESADRRTDRRDQNEVLFRRRGD